ncbi:MAG: RNA methyltransferase, partial [Eubacteriaceae bacterium]|nr:RNA methyltransferase [Eubacteriaceae bacterium]
MKENIINSAKNEHIKYLSKLKMKKYRDEYGLYLIEGDKIIQEARHAGAEFVYIIYDDRYSSNTIEAKHRLYVSNSILKSVSSLDSPQGIIAAVRIKENDYNITDGRWLLLDEIRDPQNAAAIVRSADCAGFEGVVFANNSVDIYNEKFLRAAMGSNYHIKLINSKNIDTTLSYFKDKNYHILGADLQGNESCEIKGDKILLVIGNESNG